MATPIRIKRSAVPGKRPTTEQLQLGELALNFYDGKIFLKQDQGGVGVGTRIVEVGAGSTSFVGKTLYVTSNGDDLNTGLDETNAKATIAAAAAASFPGDTIKVFPGSYVENNPINIPNDVSIEGTELRRCLVSPQDPSKDLFYVGQGNHITDLSFVGGPMTDGAAVIAFRPLLGTASDRFFDAARLIRQNLDFIAQETVGYITSTDYKNPAISIDSSNCADDIKDVYRAVCHDITRGGNSKCIGAGKSYFDINGNLDHIVGFGTTSIDAFNYSRQIARAVINNSMWGGTAAASATNISTATYDNVTGIITITSASHGLSKYDPVKLEGLEFSCPGGSGITTTIFPDGAYGSIFPVKSVVGVDTFEVVVGISTINHTYVSGGTAQKHQTYQNKYAQLRDLSIQSDPISGFNDVIPSCSNVVSAIYSCVGIVTGIIQNGIDGNSATLGFNTTYPGNSGLGVTDPSLIPLQGTGLIKKGPYIRNCTNFIPNSIGARIDGFNADEGDQVNDVGVQGSFNVDSYTQFNQGGIGVSVTNGAYAQLVSIFNICNDIAIYAGKGGQLDLTNSNTSFGTKGLVAIGVGDEDSKCIDRYSAPLIENAVQGTNVVTVSGLGDNRPYQGQLLYFGKKYFVVKDIIVGSGGTGYLTPPLVTIDAPTGPGVAIPAQASSTIDENGSVNELILVSGGSQYETVPNVTIAAPDVGFNTATATVILDTIYYDVLEATAPVSGVSTISLGQNLNNDVGIGTEVFFSRQSLQIVSSQSFQYVGAGNTIETAYPSKGGVTVQENEIITDDGGKINYTSTDQQGNFRIGDGVIINQSTGTISGNVYVKSLFSQVTPFILALGGD